MPSDSHVAGEDPAATVNAPVGTALARHLVRGAIGFGLIGSALVFTTSVGPASLLLLAPAMVALRGCPTCWIMGLIETLSAGRLERTCGSGTAAKRGLGARAGTHCRLSSNQHGPFE